ncbi:tetratricopeptide repeat protein [Spirosoma knui]
MILRFWKPSLSLLFGWLLLSLTAQAQGDSLFKLHPDQRVLRLWQSVPFITIRQRPYPQERDSTAFFAKLDRLATLAQQKDDERLYWSIQLQKILFRHTQLDLRSKPSTQFEAAQELMDQCPVRAVQAAYWYYRGRFEFGRQRFDAGFRWLLRAQQTFEQIGYGNIPEISEYLSGLGGRYYFFGEYATCIRYMEASLRYPYLTVRARLAALNTLGLCQQHLGNYPKAQRLYAQTRQLAITHRDSAYTAIATTNLGHILFLRQCAPQALPYLYQAYDLSLPTIPENAALTDLYLAKALLALDSAAKAKTYIDRSTRFYNNQVWSEYNLQYVQARTMYYKKTGNYRLAKAYLDSTLQLQDTLRARFNTRLLAASHTQANAERYLSDLRNLETEKANAVQVRNLILLALVLLALLGGYALWQNQQKRMQEKRVLEAEQQRAQQLLTQYMANLQQKNQLIETISAELNQSRNAPTQSSANPMNPATVENLLNRVILTEVDWQQFKHLLEDVYPDFFASLHNRFPDLTPAEIRLLALLKLGVSTKQMAFMLGVNMNTIRTARYRLRRKLDQHQLDINLETLIRQL